MLVSVHAITSKISPVHNSSGVEMLEAGNFRLYCFQTLTGGFDMEGDTVKVVVVLECIMLHDFADTHCVYILSSGTKFLLLTSPQQSNVDPYMKKIYDIYSDFVMKNPFHTPEMPIRSDQFDQSLVKFIQTINGS